MTPPLKKPALHIVRTPGEFGPILSCVGELSAHTVEHLKNELALLLPLGHPVLTIGLSGCHTVDVEGILAVLHASKEQQQAGRRLALIAGTGRTASLLRVMGIDEIIPTFPTEQVAARALRGGGPPAPAPKTWEEARAKTVARWKAIEEAIDHTGAEEVARQLTTMTALCDRSEEIYVEQPAPAAVRCHFCPMFHALGGQSEDIGCRSVLDPILASLRAGDREAARAQVAAMIRTLEEMPVPS
jgi:anti-anti-sigma regulatory factor